MKIPKVENFKFDQKKLFSFLESKKALVACFVVSGVLCLMWNPGERAHEIKPDPSVDTYIPEGYVLVPIEVQNYEALDSILGSHGFVDLFVPSATDKEKGRKVASRVKIMRAPLNPSQFAVLVRENESEQLVRSQFPFFVVVQNSKQSGTGFVNEEPHQFKRKASRLVMEVE